jgi:hypothetical protein
VFTNSVSLREPLVSLPHKSADIFPIPVLEKIRTYSRVTEPEGLSLMGSMCRLNCGIIPRERTAIYRDRSSPPRATYWPSHCPARASI